MARSASSSLTPSAPDKPSKPTTTTATRYSKRKRGEAPSPPLRSDVAPPVAKKRRPAPINTSGKRLPKKPAATNLPTYIQQRVAPAAPVYASPWADVNAEHWHIDYTTASDNVKVAYAVQKAIGRPQFEWEHEAGFAVWYRNINHEIETYVQHGSICMKPIIGATWVAGYGQICWRDQIAAGKPPTKRGKANPPRVRSAMEVFREGEGDDAEFFLVWEKMEDVKINGSICTPEAGETTACAAGPLPRFAVIEIEETVIFWFRDAEAMDYATAEIEQARLNDDLLGEMPEDFEGGDEEKNEEERENSLTEEERRKRSEEWRQIWLRGIQARKAEYDEDTTERPTLIKSTSDLLGDEVVSAIASLWRTIDHELGRGFAIHDYFNYFLVRGDLLNAKGYRERIPAAVHGPNDLLIPITFNSFHQSPPNSATIKKTLDTTDEDWQQTNEKAKVKKTQAGEVGRDGHILFALAQTRDENMVNVKLFDSCPGYIAKNRIMKAVSRTVQKIGWLGMDQEGWAIELEDELTVVEENELSVPMQEGIQTCGIYTILNAWMVMLGLPALNQRRREYYGSRTSGQQEANDFLNQALEMINCALAGHMDLETIQAFFNWFGYCQLQDPEDAEVRLARGYLTARMNARILNDILDEERAIGQATTEHAVDDRSFLQSSIEFVKGQTGCSHSDVMRLLECTEGDVDQAIDLRLAETTE
ncbi:MAG: hypothetical protein Q9188_007383 [Gyalolechia gomerana]